MAVGFFAAGDGEEFVLNALGDGAAGAVADRNAIDGTDWRHFDGSAAEEKFVGDVQHFAGNDLLAHGDIELAAEGHNGVASDARERAIR